jgi:hypothetical protein
MLSKNVYVVDGGRWSEVMFFYAADADDDHHYDVGAK